MTVSLGAMLKQLAGLVDTKDVNDWENGFLKNVLAASDNGARTVAPVSEPRRADRGTLE